MPLQGKIPVLDAWQSLPPATEAQVREWVEDSGYNLGIRTGAASGLVVIDDDQGRHNVAERWTPPPTDLVSESPTGGRHYYYRAPTPCPGNSASKLAPYIDVRGEGGQVVYPGSAHPITRTPYRWVRTGEPGTLPADVLTKLADPAPAPRSAAPRAAPNPDRYVARALSAESIAVRNAPEGSRNDALNRAAFSLGQLVGSGALTREAVEAELTDAALTVGLDPRETVATIRSGLTKGAAQPRSVPPPREPQRLARPASAPTDQSPVIPAERAPDVLIPGAHRSPPDGTYSEQGVGDFGRAVLAALPAGVLYRRAQTVGRIVDGSFQGVTPDTVRAAVDDNMRLGQGVESKETAIDGSPTYALVYRTCTSDMAGAVMSAAETSPTVRELTHLAAHPVCIGRDFAPARPGWNPTGPGSRGVYLADPTRYEPLDLDTSRAVLEDLVCDFPFRAPADRANFFGLLLTPILRPAIPEPVPLHLIGSPVERTGKTKLAEIVLGCSVLGTPTPALQIGVREEEREKRITALLLSGASVAHLDNLREFVDSPALASLLTSATYQGRELGLSRIVSIPNGLTLVASGNNIHATGEIAKRIVPVMLQPATETPETRQDYRHPDLRGYVESNRPRVLGALLGLLEAWRAAGRPLGPVGFGGFERWASVMGGIMGVAGYPDWLGNLTEWRGGVNDFGTELRDMVTEWYTRHGNGIVSASTLFDLAGELGLFERQTQASTDRGQRTQFGVRVISAMEGRVVDGHKIMVEGAGKRRRAWLIDV